MPAIARLLVIRQILNDDSKKVLVGEYEFDTIHLVVHADTTDMQFRFGRMLNKVSASARMYLTTSDTSRSSKLF